MQRYVQQLITQFTEAAKQRREAEATALESGSSESRDSSVVGDDAAVDREAADDADFLAHMAEVEAYLEGPPPGAGTLAELTGIPLSELPVAGAMYDDETVALVNAIQDLISAYGHTFDIIPREGCPLALVYEYVLAGLREPAMEMAGGMQHHDCGTYAPDCPFGAWCVCAEHYTKEEYQEAGGTADIPAEFFKSEADREAEDAESAAFTKEYDEQKARQASFGHKSDGLSWITPEYRNTALSELQVQVDDWINDFGVRYFNELTNTAVLTEEVGELARLSARMFGEQSFKRKADEASAKTDWADEISDVLFVLTCLANQTGVNLTEAWARGMQKRTNRDGRRHMGNEKLQ